MALAAEEYSRFAATLADLAEAEWRAPTRRAGWTIRDLAGHDGVSVAAVAAEWARRHGRPDDLTLTGPAGGHWSSGTSGEPISLDAEHFCRILSGLGSGTGLMATFVPF
jgi:hypothetical protein